MDTLHRFFLRAQPLGNTGRKYVRAVERHGERLLAALEASGHVSQVHIDRTAPSVADDFDAVAAAAGDQAEALALLGTYYGIQHVHLNARALERLAVDLAEGAGRRDAYRSFLLRAEADFTSLIGAYIRRVLRVLMPARLRGEFLLCSVGTRSHQDDIDVAVIDENGPARPQIDRALGQLTVQMLRYASTLDHYLAARVKPDGIALSPEELGAALGGTPLDFVVVTELLRAEPLAGSRRLLRRLRSEVVAPFLYREGADNTCHEHYVRGLLGEIRSLLLRPAPPGSINPKDDALRIIVGLTLALKTAEGLEAVRPRDVLRVLRHRRPALRTRLLQLEENLVYLDTFHHLAHLLIAEEEQIEVEGTAARDNLRRVAETMGYTDHGPVRAADQLLVHYHEAVGSARELALSLMEEAARHLRETSRFSRWTRGAPGADGRALATELAAGAHAFLGGRFWDDVLEALGAPDGRLLGEFAEGFAALPAERRAELARSYADWGRDAPYAFLTILVLLARRRRGGPAVADDPATELTRVYLERLGSEAEDIRALSRTFRFYPGLLNRFLLTLDRGQLERLIGTLGVSIGNPQVARARDRFRAFIHVHRDVSRYVQRVLARLTERHPATVLAVGDDAALRTLARGRLAAAERHPNGEVQKGLLGDFYDMEFLRIALGTLSGRASELTRAEFAELTRTYLGDLFDICVREAERERGTRMLHRDRLGIWLAGGHARSRPFDEDYDFLALIDARDPDDRRLAERALVLMNRQIAHRGVVAQYRLGERVGRFVVTFDEATRFAREAPGDFFVDLHQRLGARRVAGSARADATLAERILVPFVFDDPERFAGPLVNEIVERRKRLLVRPDGTLHIKNMRGGLREIDLAIAAARARFAVREPGIVDFSPTLCARDPAHAALYVTLARTDAFLVAVRSAYRVLVAATDVLEREFAEAPARLLGFGGAHDPAGALFAELVRQTSAAGDAVDELVAMVRA